MTAITTIPPLDRTSATFRADVDAYFSTKIPLLTTELNTLADVVEAQEASAIASAADALGSETAAAASETAAALSAAAAATSAGAPIWANTGASYTIGQKVSSPVNGRIYFRLTAGTAGTTDPSVDTTNWQIMVTGPVSTAVKTSAYNAIAGDLVPCNTTGGAFNVTLPPSPVKDDFVTVMDYAGKFATNNLTALGNGKPIQGAMEDFICDINRETRTFVYIDATQGWEVI